MSKREALKNMIGQARLMEIIDRAYENANNCENCKDLADWWEKYGAALPAPSVVTPSGKERRR